MLVDLWSLPDEFLFLVTNKLYFHELCRLRRACKSFDVFVEERRHRYTIHTKFQLDFCFDAIPDGSAIQDREQGEVVVFLDVASDVAIYLADPYSQLSAVYFDYIRIYTYPLLKSEKLTFPPDKMYEKRVEDEEDEEEDVLRVIDLDIVNLLSSMRLRCKNFNFQPLQKEKNPWFYLSSVAFRNLVILNQEDLNILTVQDLKRLATTTKCQKILSRFGNITEEIVNALGAFTHVCITTKFGDTRGSINWLHDYIEKLLAGETCGRLKELNVSLWKGGIFSIRWKYNPNFVELFKSEILRIYLIRLPNNQFAFLREVLQDETTTLLLARTDPDNLWTRLQKFPYCLYGNGAFFLSPLVENILEQNLEKCQTFFHSHKNKPRFFQNSSVFTYSLE